MIKLSWQALYQTTVILKSGVLPHHQEHSWYPKPRALQSLSFYSFHLCSITQQWIRTVQVQVQSVITDSYCTCIQVVPSDQAAIPGRQLLVLVISPKDQMSIYKAITSYICKYLPKLSKYLKYIVKNFSPQNGTLFCRMLKRDVVKKGFVIKTLRNTGLNKVNRFLFRNLATCGSPRAELSKPVCSQFPPSTAHYQDLLTSYFLLLITSIY